MEKQRMTFLSYSRANKDFALRLAKELKSEGFHVWLDQLDIPPGSRWDVEVEKALVESEIFMIIITKASIVSNNVLDEIGYAIDHGKRFLPVLLEDCNIPLRLRRFQYVDFTDKNFDEGVQSAKALLRDLIAQPTVPRKDISRADQDEATASQAERPAAKDESGEKHATEQTDETTGQEDLIATTHFPPEEGELEASLMDKEAKIKEEMDELEKRLEEERHSLRKIEALRKSKGKDQTRSSKARASLIGIFGVSILVVIIAGYSIIRYLAGPAVADVPTQTMAPAQVSSTDTPAGPVVTEPSRPSSVPTTEVSSTPEEPTATEIPATPEPADTLTPAGSSLPEVLDSMGAQMLLVPDGDFSMGSSRGQPDEQPVHTVYLEAFYIDKFEVTNGLYKACVEAGSCDPPRQSYFFPESPNRIYYGNPQYDQYPVIYVDWNMAKAYCEWRGVRLPTEAEWEKAARGTQGSTYPWGKDLSCQRANYQGCVNRTSEVGSYDLGVSPYGVHDMTGNVWEWVADWYSNNYYSISPLRNPRGPITGQARVLRGGGWPRYDVTAYHRIRFAADYNTLEIGFRCARDVDP